MKNLRAYVALLIITVIAANLTGCTTTAKAGSLMDGISPNTVSGKPVDNIITKSIADFSIDLFKKSITDNQNSLISPLSVMFALAMTANGADTETLVQMEALLGGGVPLGELNEYLYSYIRALPSTAKSKLSIANSIWFRDNNDLLRVESAFLQTNADYYGAEAYSSAFDSQTVKEINNWVKTNTAGMVDSIIDRIIETEDIIDVMYLINAVMFDAEWRNVYHKEDIQKGDFTDIIGTIRYVDFMHSIEGAYLDDGLATGFIKPYADGGYSFIALLPNENVPIETYIDTLTGEGFLETLRSAQQVIVNTFIPKFGYDYSISMNDALSELGIPDAFDREKADFSRMGVSPFGNIWISEVLHKTFISVDELGTKAGAVTRVSMAAPGSAPNNDPKTVRLDRPFVYAIIDNTTNLPVFIGTVMTV